MYWEPACLRPTGEQPQLSRAVSLGSLGWVTGSPGSSTFSLHQMEDLALGADEEQVGPPASALKEERAAALGFLAASRSSPISTTAGEGFLTRRAWDQ